MQRTGWQARAREAGLKLLRTPLQTPLGCVRGLQGSIRPPPPWLLLVRLFPSCSRWNRMLEPVGMLLLVSLEYSWHCGTRTCAACAGSAEAPFQNLHCCTGVLNFLRVVSGLGLGCWSAPDILHVQVRLIFGACGRPL